MIATQNPVHYSGTFPLPESQLDRFLMRIRLGYPDPRSERSLLKGEYGRPVLDSIRQVVTVEALLKIQRQIGRVKASEALLDYVQRLVEATRNTDQCQLGLSPRGAIALLRSAQSWALIQGREYVLPEDVQAVFVAVAGHRIIGSAERHGDQLARHILSSIDVVA